MFTWEVFNVWTGRVVNRTMTESAAKRIAIRMGGSYDYAKKGQGF